MPHKTFTTFTDAATEPVTFDINDRTFRCVDMLPGTRLLTFMSVAGSGDSKAADAVLDLLRDAVHEDEREAFFAYVNNPQNKVSLEVLSELAGYLADKLSGADPTKRPDVPSYPG